jgi:tape measure domain-containing protein
MNVGTLEIKLLANMARLQADMDKASNSVDRAMRGIDKSVGVAKKALGGLTTAFSLSQVLKVVDEYKKFDAQLKLSARTATEYAAAYSDVVRISRTSQSDIAAVGNLYARLALNMRDAGIAQDQVARTTEAITLALRVKNATVQETNSVMLQLSQSFGSGRLNGQEFLAVAEGAPPLLQRLAKSMGVPFGALKDLSAQGKITRDELLKAFSDPEYIASLREQVKEVGTVSSAFVVLINNLKQYLGEQDKAAGVTKVLQLGILGVADSLGTLVRVGLAVGAVAFGRLAASMYDTVKAQQAAIAADTAAQAKKVQLARATLLYAQETYKAASSIGASTLALNNNAAATTNAARAAGALAVAQGRLATVTATASVAVRALGTAVAFLGGPLGIAIGLIVLFGDKIVDWMNRTRGMTPALRDINDELDRQNRLKREGIAINDPMAEEKSRAAQLQEQINQLTEARARYQAIAKDPSIATAMERQRLVGLGVANAQLLQTRAAEAARGQSEKLRVAYDLLTKASAAIEQPVNSNVATFAMLTSELKLATVPKAEYAAQSQAIIDAAKREGKSQAELAEALAALRAKLLKADVKADSAAAKQALKDLQAEIDFEQQAETTANKVAQKEQEERNKQVLKDLQAEIDFEEDQRAVQWKAEADEREDRLKEEKRIAKEIANAQKAEFERIQGSISRAISDGLFDGFESGKPILENFKSVAIRALKAIFVQPLIERMIAGPLKAILGAIGSVGVTNTAFAGADGLVASGGGFSIGNVLSGIKTSFDAFSGNLVGGIEKLGVMLANGQGGILDAVGGFMGQYAAPLTTALAFAPAVFSLLKGDFKGAALSGGGAGIGFMLGGPAGAAIGGALGSLLGGAFGSKPKNPRFTGQYQASFGAKGRISGGSVNAAGKDTAIFNEGLSGASNDFYAQLSGFLKGMGQGVEKLATDAIFSFKEGKNTIGSFVAKFNGKQVGFGSEGFGKDVEAGFAAYMNKVLSVALVDAVRNSNVSQAVKDLIRGTNAKIVMGLMAGTVALNATAEELGDSFGLTVDQAARVARASGFYGQEILDFTNLLAGTAASLQKPSEVLLTARDNITKAMNGILGSVNNPQSLEDFDAILKGIDVSTKSGMRMFADIFKLRSGFAQFSQGVDALRTGVKGSIFDMLSPDQQQIQRQVELAEAFEKLNLAVPGSISELIEMGRGIDYTTEAGLDLAAAFPSLVEAFKATQTGVDGLTNSLAALDANRFKTLVDLTRAQRYQQNGIPLSMLPSYDVGTSSVPRTGPAMIHANERIFTGTQNEQIVAAVQSAGAGNAELVREIRELRAEMRAGHTAMVIPAQKTAALLNKFDREGILIAELDNDGEPYVVPVIVTNSGAAEAVPVDTTP